MPDLTLNNPPRRDFQSAVISSARVPLIKAPDPTSPRRVSKSRRRRLSGKVQTSSLAPNIQHRLARAHFPLCQMSFRCRALQPIGDHRGAPPPSPQSGAVMQLTCLQPGGAYLHGAARVAVAPVPKSKCLNRSASISGSLATR